MEKNEYHEGRENLERKGSPERNVNLGRNEHLVRNEDREREEQKWWEEAYTLHCRYPVADAHFDLPVELYYRRRKGERRILADRYCPIWRRAGINLVVAAVFLEDELLPELALRRTLEQIAALRSEIEESDGRVFLVTNANELREAATDHNRTGIILYLEGLDCIQQSVELLPLFYELGVRGAALTWSRKNTLATGCCRAGSNENLHGCISRTGWEVIGKMQELGMFLDMSHLNDDGIAEVLGIQNMMPIATHSNAREIYSSYRNLTNEQLHMIGERGGLVGFTQNRYLTGGDERMLLHMKKLLEQAGNRNVCLGLDLGEPINQVMQRGVCETSTEDGIAGYEELLSFTARMLQAGIAKETVTGILGRNLIEHLSTIFAQI